MLTPLHILVLEDHEEDAELVIREIQRGGYDVLWERVDTEAAYTTALYQAPARPYDLILADYYLPQFNAAQALKILHATGLDLPLIVVTGAIGEEAAVECLQQGAANYILKDRLGRLLPAVRRALADHQVRVEKRRADIALRESATRLQLLNSILMAANLGQPVEMLVQQTLQRLNQAFPYGRAFYATLDEAGDLRIADAVEPPDRPALITRHIPWGQAPHYLQALRQHDVVSVADVANDSQLEALRPALALGHTAALLYVPFRHFEWPASLLGLEAFAPRAWSEHETATLTEVANYLAMIFQNDRTRQERLRAEESLAQHAKRLTALSHLGQVAVASLDRDEILRQATREIITLVGAEGVAMALRVDDSPELILVAASGAGLEALRGMRVPTTSAVLHHVLETPRALQILEPSPELASLTTTFANLREPPQAALLVPLGLREDVLGVMLALHTHPGAFTAEHLPLLEAAADWVAIAIGNARLFAEVTESLARERRLEEVARLISGTLDLPLVLQTVAQLATDLTGAEAGALALVDTANQTLTFSYLVNLPESAVTQIIPHSNADLSWQVVETGKVRHVAHYAQHPQALAMWKALGVQELLVVPLTAGDERLGVLTLFHLSAQHHFEPRDTTAAESVGQQAGVALQNARLYDSQRRRVLALTALHQTSLDLGTEQDLNILLKTIIERSAHMLDSTIGGLYLIQENDHLLELVVSINMASRYVGTQLQLGEDVAGRVAQSGSPVLVGDYAQWSGRAAAYQEAPFRSMVGVPIKWHGQDVLGVLSISDVRPNRYTQSDVEIISLFADQAAVAIVNARQHASLRRRLQESEAMAAISRALNETLNPDRILDMIVDAARRIIPQVERAVIHLLDEEKQALRPAAVAGIDSLGRPDFTMRPGEGVAGQVIAEGVVLNVGDTRTDPRYLPMGRATHLRSLLVAPVQSGQRRLGTISVMGTAPNSFTTDDEWLLATLGVQAGLALENARLFEVERRRAEEAEALQQVTQPLISRVHLSEMLLAVVNVLTTSANYKYVSIYLLEDEVLRLQAQTGAHARPAVWPREQGLIGRAVQSGQVIFVADVSINRDYVEVIPGVRSFIAVPLIHTNQTFGVLVVEGDVEHSLDEGDLAWLTNVGRQVSVAIQNRRLVADLERALQQEQTARAQMVQTEKLAAMGRLVASVAHELNNPLQAIQNALYLVKQETGLRAQAREDLQIALTEVDRMAELISRLRETYRPATRADFQPESLNVLVEDVQRLIATHLRHSNIVCEARMDPRLPLVRGLRDQLKQALLNLCLNAVEAMPAGGHLTIHTTAFPDENQVSLTIQDTGVGIAPEALPNVFDPFFTTKDSGTGLGLAITHDIVRRHGGHIDVHSQQGQGTQFVVWLPVQT